MNSPRAVASTVWNESFGSPTSSARSMAFFGIFCLRLAASKASFTSRLSSTAGTRSVSRFACGVRTLWLDRGVSLDRFSAEDNRIDPASIGMPPLREHVTRHRGEYERVAAARRARLRQRGYFSAADVRAEVILRLRRNDWAASVGRALAARFAEVIVDEGQDCNPLDCSIIYWLRTARIPVTVVADPDQAIYGFRHGTPADLRTLANGYSADDRLPLTGNFRSGPAICAIAATLRQRVTPDISMDEAARFLEPVHIAAYQGRS